MFKKGLCGLVLAALLTVAAPAALAWDEVGHKITAYIAWQQMTPDVRERVIKLLLAAPEDSQLATFYMSYGSQDQETRQRQFFMLAATWADIIRDRSFSVRQRKYNHSDWHYRDTMWTVKDGKIEILNAPEDPDGGGLAVDKLNEYGAMARGNATDAQKAIAIAWLEHLIGDIHQPLHVSARVTDVEPKGDKGGNTFLLTPEGTPKDKQENLHWLWDSIIDRSMPNTKNLCDQDYLEPIAQKIIKMYPYAKLQGGLLPGKFEDWARESSTLAQTEVYSGVERGKMPSDGYKKRALEISQKRMALAGYRMGELFNQIFAAPKQ